MIIKEADNKDNDLAILNNLLTHSLVDDAKRKRIKQEIRNIKAGIRGENEAAYEMKVHYEESINWIVIHDLRIEHNGLVAQIDHLLINRFFEIWVCESKHFSEGIAINEHGEFSAFFGSKPYGVPSPIEQNNNHVKILARALTSGSIKLPTRLGFTIKPKLNSFVLVSKHARISRPKAKVSGLECIIKNDQLFDKLTKIINSDNKALGLAKLIGTDTLLSIAQEIAALHQPITFDWPTKFGLPHADVSQKAPVSIDNKTDINTNGINQDLTTEETLIASPKEKKKLICQACNDPIAYNVAKFCWFNKRKFGGNAYCVACQKNIATT